MAGLPPFPDEIYIYIFENLDTLSLAAVSATCRLWNELVKTPALLYIVLCHRYGMVDGPPHEAWPVSRRIKALREHYARWMDLNWCKRSSFDRNAERVWELCGGVYAEDNMVSSKPGVLEFRNTTCVTTAEPETRWTLDTGLEIEDFGMDPFQDLLVIVMKLPSTSTYREVHIRTLSTGKEHPHAQNPRLRVEVQPRPQEDDLDVQVANDFVGVLFQNEEEYEDYDMVSNDLVVWNWKTSQIIFEQSSTSEYFISCFCFIARNQILLGTQSLTQDSSNNSLTLIDITSLTTPVKTFLLPPIHSTTFLSNLSIDCDPVPTASLLRHRPFYIDPSKRICVVTLRYLYENVIEELTPINLIFFTSSLIDISPLNPHSTKENIISWDQWSKYIRVTNWESPSETSTLCANGTRFVRAVSAPSGSHYCIQICDFNKHMLANWEKTDQPNDSSRTRYVDANDVNPVTLDHIFKEPLYSYLPYLEVTTTKHFWLDEIMIDHDNIYLVREDQGEIHVLSF